jgi:hypothetical protein
MDGWTAPRLWPAGAVAVLASGPSLTAAQANAVRHARAAGVLQGVLAINTTGLTLARFADVHYACDAAWWRAHPDAVAIDRLKVTVEDLPEYPSVKRLALSDGKQGVGFDPDPRFLRSGCNSGHQAVHLAAHLIAHSGRILLLGFDMSRPREGPAHHHGDHPKGLNNPSAPMLQRWAELFGPLARGLAAQGIEVINCTPGSALTCFPWAPLEEGLRRCASRSTCTTSLS